MDRTDQDAGARGDAQAGNRASGVSVDRLSSFTYDKRTETFKHIYGVAGRPLPVENPIRNVRLDLEESARVALDLPEDAYYFGDLRLTLKRSDWTLHAELDVHIYAKLTEEDLED